MSEFDLTHDFGGISLCQGAAQPLGQARRAQDLDLFDSVGRDFAQDSVGQPFHGAIFFVFAEEGHGFIDDAMGITALGELDCREAQKIHDIGGGLFAQVWLEKLVGALKVAQGLVGQAQSAGF